MPSNPFPPLSSSDRSAVEKCLEKFKEGGFVMVMDREDRENECDLIIAGEGCTKEKMAFMLEWSTGIVCVVAEKERLEGFGLYPAVREGENTDANVTNFYVATDFLPGTTTGVSAADRSATLRAFCDRSHPPSSFSKPGHMFPLCPRQGGLLERDGHTESAFELCRLAGCKDNVSAIGEMMDRKGEMMRLDECREFSKKFGIPLITVPQLKAYVIAQNAGLLDPVDARAEPESAGFPKKLWEEVEEKAEVYLASECALPLAGNFVTMKVFKLKEEKKSPSFSREFTFLKNQNSDEKLGKSLENEVSELAGPLEIVAITKGDLQGKEEVPVRIHSECFTGDVLGSLKCDCGPQLSSFLGLLASQWDSGCLLYMRGHEGRGIGLVNKVKAYKLQEGGVDTIQANLQLGFPVDLRSFAPCVSVLHFLGVKSISLYTNNPSKMDALSPLVARVEPLATLPNPSNISYLQTKMSKMQHRTILSTMTWPSEPVQPMSQCRVAVVSARWNESFSKILSSACVKVLKEAQADVRLVEVPGAVDLVAGARAVYRKMKPDAIVCVGVLIKGETDAHEHNCSAVATGLAALNASNLLESCPVIHGVLMCKDEEQARKRATAELGAAYGRQAKEMITVNKDLEIVM